MRNEIKTLGDALPEEIRRVQELVKIYRSPELGGSGEFAALMMEGTLKRSKQALLSGDTAAMIIAYNDLKSFKE